MQRSALWTASLLTTAALFSAGCSDLGSCEDPAKGRTTATLGGELYFTGQAIVTQSCATGCHSSAATGAARHGAPGDLNFDLIPLTAGAPVKDGSGNVVAVQLDAKALAGLRSRQRRVYEQREAIWDQIQDGLMPPSKFAAFKSLASIIPSMFGSDGKCTGTGALTSLDADKDALRKWLACDTPVIETSSKDLPFKAPAAGAQAYDSAAGSVYYATVQSVGYQYPACGGGGGGGGGAPSFSELYQGILKPQCGLCHPAVNAAVDFSTEDLAYSSLLGSNGMGKPQMVVCAGNKVPYVTPGDPSKSYLLPKMDKAKASGVVCDTLMPQTTGGADAATVAKVRAWIMAGALRMPAASAGGDAGVADAGN